MKKIKLGIVVADFNHDITLPMFNEAKRLSQKLSLQVTYTCFVPGVLIFH